jgi:hypothetical protein
MNVVIVKRVNNHYFKILRETLTLFFNKKRRKCISF